MPMQVPGYHTNTPLHPSFETDIRDVHLIYDYDAEGDDGKPQKWRYEMWFFSHDRIVYSIHGGPMAGRLNYQTVAFQCIRPGELWQCNWLEETGTIVSLVYDIINKKITTMIGFSKGHWENSKAAHGDKRNPEDYARWRSLADAGNQRDRLILSEQATILAVSKGAGDLVPIAPDAETLILMELLVWHDALGSDDEQATDEERAARLLYAHTALDASVASTATDVEDDATQHQQVRGMHALQFMEALVAFTRLMRCPLAGAPQWISVVLATRRFYVQEVEPHVFFALGVKTTELCGTDLRSVHAALLQQIYDMFCLLYGQIDRQLRVLSENVASQFDDGLALLHHIATLRRRLRKISLALELEDHDGHDSQDDRACMQRHEEETQLKQELAALVASSPSRMVWQRCDALFPTLLSGLEVQRMNMFHEVDGVAYFPMDETTFLSMQTLVNSFLSELHSVVSGGIALFFKGNVIWRTIDAHTLHTLQSFLCLREQDGMDVASPQSRVSAASDVWMAGKYDDAFSPIWASKTSYAECAVVHHIAPQPRRSSRFLHKQTPMSLNTLINELIVGNAPPSAAEELHRIRRSQRYRSDAPVYRNRGFLTTNGYFLPSWELAKPASDDMAWALPVYPNQSTKPSTALLYHENDLSLLVLTQTSGNNHTTLMRHMERIEDCVEKLQFTAMASTIWKNYLTLTGSQPSREKVSSTSQSPYIYLNRVNLAFKVSDQIPRLVKTKDADLYPRPASLWAHYFPTASLELLNDAHETLQSDHETIELRIKTVNDGWLVAHRSRSSDRELYALLDTKTASVTDAQDATTDLLAAQFSNIYL